MNTLREINLGVSGESFPEGTHVCLIYDDDDERNKVITRFLIDGILNNEKVGYFGESSSSEGILDLLESADVGSMHEVGLAAQFEFFDSASIYCPNGKFESVKMIEKLKNYYRSAIEAGYTGARASG